MEDIDVATVAQIEEAIVAMELKMTLRTERTRLLDHSDPRYAQRDVIGQSMQTELDTLHRQRKLALGRMYRSSSID